MSGVLAKGYAYHSQITSKLQATDCIWVDLLRQVRHGECHEDLKTLLDWRPMPPHKLQLSSCVVTMKWNSMTALSKTRGLILINCPAFDTAQGHQPNLEKRWRRSPVETNSTNMVDYRRSRTCTGHGSHYIITLHTCQWSYSQLFMTALSCIWVWGGRQLQFKGERLPLPAPVELCSAHR